MGLTLTRATGRPHMQRSADCGGVMGLLGTTGAAKGGGRGGCLARPVSAVGACVRGL
jgi:hypothetical protein